MWHQLEEYPELAFAIRSSLDPPLHQYAQVLTGLQDWPFPRAMLPSSLSLSSHCKCDSRTSSSWFALSVLVLLISRSRNTLNSANDQKLVFYCKVVQRALGNNGRNQSRAGPVEKWAVGTEASSSPMVTISLHWLVSSVYSLMWWVSLSTVTYMWSLGVTDADGYH